jgi:hypothetical protein
VDSGGYDDDLPGKSLAVWYTSVGTFGLFMFAEF